MKNEPRTPIARSLAPEIAARARARRESLRRSVQQLAALVDVTPPTIARWESGDLPDSMRSTRINAWEAALRVPSGWLLSPDGKSVPEPSIEDGSDESISITSGEHLHIPEEEARAVGERARERRRSLGMSRAELSERAGLSVATLFKWEAGELPRSIRSSRLLLWEAALALPEGWLVTPGEEAPVVRAARRQSVVIAADSIAEAIRKVAVCLATRGRNEAFPDELIGAVAQRDAELFSLRYGVNGRGCATLHELAAPHGITRERVRQIVEKLTERSAQFEFDIPVIDSIQAACGEHLPCPASVLNEHLHAQLGERLTIEDANLFANEVLGRRIVRISEPIAQPNAPRIDLWAYNLDDVDVVDLKEIKSVRSVAYAMIRSSGVAHLHTVAGAASLDHGLHGAKLASMLQSVEGFEWLDADRTWFWFGPERPGHNIIISVARKVFAVARERVDIADLLAAIMRYRSRTVTTEFDRDRSLMLIPPIHIARAVLERLDWLKVVQHDDYRATLQLDQTQELSETELRLVAALEACNGVASRFELRSALPDVKLITFSASLMTTPVVRLVCTGIYAFVGRPLDPAAFARAVSP